MNTKCEKIIKGEENVAAVKEYLKSIYKYIRETYKYYSGITPNGRVHSIGPNIMTELLHNCEGFIDGKNVRLADIDLEVIACKQRVNHWLRPEKQLVRCQFLECLVRLSFDKYLKPGIAKTP